MSKTSAFLASIKNDNTEIVKLFISKGVDVNEKEISNNIQFSNIILPL